ATATSSAVGDSRSALARLYAEYQCPNPRMATRHFLVISSSENCLKFHLQAELQTRFHSLHSPCYSLIVAGGIVHRRTVTIRQLRMKGQASSTHSPDEE